MQQIVRRFEVTTSDGLTLRGEAFGDHTARGLPVVCLPGLARTSRDFHQLAERLTSDPDHPRLVLTLNSRGRGPSDYDKDPRNYDVMTEARDVIDTLVAAGLPEAAFIGTSRGGLLMLAIAAMRPTLIAAAVFNDIGPVIDAMGVARIKTYLTRSEPVRTWDDAVEFVKTANAHHFTTLSERDWERVAQMTFRDENGLPVSDFDPYIIKALEGVDVSETTINLWPQFLALSHCPTLVLRGDLSDILPLSVAREMTRRHPDCELVEIKGHGHAPLMIFDEVNDPIAAFLARVDARRTADAPKASPEWLPKDEIVYLDDVARQVERNKAQLEATLSGQPI
ncbi:alpha/beta hydrolase [uncultured Cohaesibacter sp.]|uniref:alpha/beta fold hydrolase n=1 Tax=uncultured Cohaesibacter sp. TaxID=1002546 RepID=UPI0029C716D5|nr:alpha/beta hydrolase [uncultured Cohaesibacter sp.]